MWTKTFRRIETIAAVWSLLGRCCAWGVYSQSVSWGLANVTLKHQASLSSCVAVHNNDGRHALIVCWARASHLCLFEGEKILQQVRGWRRQTWGEILMWTGCLGRKPGGGAYADERASNGKYALFFNLYFVRRFVCRHSTFQNYTNMYI